MSGQDPYTDYRNGEAERHNFRPGEPSTHPERNSAKEKFVFNAFRSVYHQRCTRTFVKSCADFIKWLVSSVTSYHKFLLMKMYHKLSGFWVIENERSNLTFIEIGKNLHEQTHARTQEQTQAHFQRLKLFWFLWSIFPSFSIRYIFNLKNFAVIYSLKFFLTKYLRITFKP